MKNKGIIIQVLIDNLGMKCKYFYQDEDFIFWCRKSGREINTNIPSMWDRCGCNGDILHCEVVSPNKQ